MEAAFVYKENAMTQEQVEAVSVAIQEAMQYGSYHDAARAALVAHATATGEKVIYVNESMSQLGLRIAGFEYGHIFPGEELVLRRKSTE